ncbi:MAG: NYN domain-containing protein [Tissierellia bacterium]|nr:NYN domain-containing protein [Tissierellia bacterium]
MRKKKTYLLVDGYNIINQWEELQDFEATGLDSSRLGLMETMAEYAALTGEIVVLIFDAHQVKGSVRKHERYKGIEVVYTREFETADTYIERRLDRIGRKDIVKVATSDSMIQNIILGRGGVRLSGAELKIQVQTVKNSGKRMAKDLKRISHRNLVKLDERSLRALEQYEFETEEQLSQPKEKPPYKK